MEYDFIDPDFLMVIHVYSYKNNIGGKTEMVRKSEKIELASLPDETKVIIDAIVFQIKRLIQSEEYHTKALNKEYQVSAPQLNCLMALFKNGPLPPSQIARHILVESSTVTGIIDRLEQKGFVKRIRSSQDRRKIFIELTDSGRMLSSYAPPPIQLKLHEGLKQLDRRELDKILEVLSMLTGLLDFHN
jgi:DNA-binding MarR family transcriptional regulator